MKCLLVGILCLGFTGALNASSSFVRNPVGGAPAVLLVVGDAASLTAGDTALQSRLESTLGYAVTLISDETAAPDLAGFDLVVCSYSVSGSTLGTKYTAATIGVLFSKETSIDDFAMSGSGGGTTGAITNIFILATGHYIVSTLTPSANVTILTSSLAIVQETAAQLLTDTTILAQVDSGNTLATLVVASGGSFAGRRVFFGGLAQADSLAAGGLTILDRSIAWCGGEG